VRDLVRRLAGRLRPGAGARAGDAIRLVTSRYLGGKRFLTLVEVDGERLLLGLAGDRISLVSRLGGGAAKETEAS
jgi:flagellar biogenesis protein FliO